MIMRYYSWLIRLDYMNINNMKIECVCHCVSYMLCLILEGDLAQMI